MRKLFRSRRRTNLNGNCSKLIFPNIEMRLDVVTAGGRWANVHLPVSPEDPDHLIEIERLVGFVRKCMAISFSCTRGGSDRIGSESRISAWFVDVTVISLCGASQFKVGFSQLRDEFRKRRLGESQYPGRHRWIGDGWYLRRSRSR